MIGPAGGTGGIAGADADTDTADVGAGADTADTAVAGVTVVA